MTKATLKDVAERAGVSYQTVSKVLNGGGTVAPETSARIYAAAEALAYKVNISARNLRKQLSFLIGYPIQRRADDSPTPIIDQFHYNIVSAAEEQGYHLLTFLADYGAAVKLDIFSDLIGRRQVDGFILADTNHDDPRVAHLMAQAIPFVTFGRANAAWDHCWVDVDGHAGMSAVVTHLIAQGHRRIALVAWPEGSKAGFEREQGYAAAHKAAGLPVDPGLLVRGENHVGTGVRALHDLWALPPDRRPTAFACVSDTIAVGVLNGAVPLGLAVGRDLAVTGYDDSPVAQYLFPALTSVHQPIPAVGYRAVDLLLRQINRQPIDQPRVLLVPELIVRQSSQWEFSNA